MINDYKKLLIQFKNNLILHQQIVLKLLMMNSSRSPSRTAYRSFRYSLNRQENVKTADPSSLPKFRIKKNSVLESTMMRTGGFDTYQMSKTLSTANQFESKDYLRNFTSAMDCERKTSLVEKQQWRVKPLRFRIQNFQELETSDFTLLDPFHRHFKAIQTNCQLTQQQLKKQSQQIKQIKGELQNVNKRIVSTLSQVQRNSLNQLQKFTALIKQNSIKQQQVKLRFKQQIAALEIQHQQTIKKVQNELQRTKNLQEVIFSCKPYELQENQDWKEMSNTATTLGVREGTIF